MWPRLREQLAIELGLIREKRWRYASHMTVVLLIGLAILVGQWEMSEAELPAVRPDHWLTISWSRGGAPRWVDNGSLIKAPVPHWSEFVRERRDLREWDHSDLENKVASLSQETDFFVSLDGGPSDDPYTLAGLWHTLLKARMSEVPTAVFMGGTANGTHLAVVKRALAPTDFVRLWSGGKGLEVGGEDAGGAVGGHRLD